MRHRLLVLAAIGGKFVPHMPQRLTHAGKKVALCTFSVRGMEYLKSFAQGVALFCDATVID